MRELLPFGILPSIVYPQVFPGADPGDPAILRRLASEYGFKALELTRIPDPRTKAHLYQLVAEFDLELVLLGGLPMLRGGYNLAASGLLRRETMDFARSLVEEAYELGARSLMLVSGPDPGPAGRPVARERLVESLTELCRYASARADKYCLTICLEPTDRELERNQLIGPTAEAVAVAAAVADTGTNNISINLDLSHLHQLGERPEEALRQAAPWCRHIHLANCVIRNAAHPAYGDKHPPFGISESEVGTAELASFLVAMANTGYFFPTRPTIVGLEVRPALRDDPWQTLDDAFRAVREALTDATAAMEGK